jgi:hypothetical protein
MADRPGAEVCTNCKGNGHGSAQCSSKGGGKYSDTSKGKGKGYGKPGFGGGGKGFGKGYGNKGAFGKGKGKSKGVYGIDDPHSQWAAEWDQQWPAEWPPAQTSQAAWPPAAAAAAALPVAPQYPWMNAAAATSSPTDPWAWAGGFHSLAPAKANPKVLPIAPVKRPVSTHNMFSALSENVGASGQTSQLSMNFGEVARILPQRPRRGKRATISRSAPTTN